MRLGKAADGLKDWERAGDLGDADAQKEVGRACMIGIPGVLAPSPKTAIDWFRKSATHGNPDGQSNLAIATARSVDQK
jgi:TPR repeat protein